MELKDIVLKLIGEVKPVGESNEDEKRFENLKNLCSLTDDLLTVIDKIVMCKDDYRSSVKEAGEYADKFLTKIGIEE